MQNLPVMQGSGVDAQPFASTGSSMAALVWPALRGHAPILALVLVHIVSALTLSIFHPAMSRFDVAEFVRYAVAFLVLILPLSLVLCRLYFMVLQEKPKHPIAALWRNLRAYVGTPARLVNGTIAIALYIVFVATFSHLKTNLTVIQPFAWDATFHAWDMALFFGHIPFEVFHPIVGFAPVTFLIDVLYKMWFFVMWLMVVAFAFASGPSELRMRFFLAYMLIWALGGNLLATLFSSAGPCFYGLLGLQPNPYAPLMSYLADVDQLLPLFALETQALLWAGYEGRAADIGISAMPSMHNATALLMALVGYKLDRRLGHLLSLFTVVTFVGSVALAWHYAVDGLLAFAVVVVAWVVAGRIARWWEAREAAIAHAAACGGAQQTN